MYKKAINYIEFTLVSIWGLVCLVLIGCGFFIIGEQIYNWLKTNVWNELPLINEVALLPQDNIFVSWINNPESWHGLHKIIVWILEIIPLSLFTIYLGWLLFFVGIWSMLLIFSEQQDEPGKS